MRLMFWIAVWTFVADQVTKYIVVQWLNLRDVLLIEIAPPYLVFQMAWNRGVNFGLFAGLNATLALIILAVLICAGVIYWMWREGGSRWAYISAGLLLGGAFGNILDRIVYGAVADFINMSCCGIRNPYAFNLADMAIFVGAVGLIIFTGPVDDVADPKTAKAKAGSRSKGRKGR